jgi:hypothetical protein
VAFSPALALVVLRAALAIGVNACGCCYHRYRGRRGLRGRLLRLLVGSAAADRCAGSSTCSATYYGARFAAGVLPDRGACTTADRAADHGAGTALRRRAAEGAAYGSAYHCAFIAADFLADRGTSGPAQRAADGAFHDRIGCKAHARESERGDGYYRFDVFHESSLSAARIRGRFRIRVQKSHNGTIATPINGVAAQGHECERIARARIHLHRFTIYW